MAAAVPASAQAPTPSLSAQRIAVPTGLVVLAALAGAAGALIKFDFSARALVAAIFCAVLVVLSAIDLERRVIPNSIVVPAGVIVLLGNVAAQPHRAKEWTIAAVATLAGALAFSVATRGGVGMGDVKLSFLLGAGLGWHVLGGLVLAMGATFVVAVGILVRRGLGARRDTIAFGPLLAFGAVVELFLS